MSFITVPIIRHHRPLCIICSQPTALMQLATPLLLSRNFSKIDFASAQKEFVEQISEEIAYENEIKQELPTYPKFDISITGTTAKLVRKFGKTIVTIVLNSNDKEEPEFGGQRDDDDVDDLDEDRNTANSDTDEPNEDENDVSPEDQEFMYLPLITIQIRKLTGHQLELECSFNNKGNSLKEILTEGLHITSARVIGPNQNSKHSYLLETGSWDGNLYDSLVIYVQSLGLDQNFLAYLIKFYQIFEHRSYLDLCLTKLQDFYKD